MQSHKSSTGDSALSLSRSLCPTIFLFPFVIYIYVYVFFPFKYVAAMRAWSMCVPDTLPQTLDTEFFFCGNRQPLSAFVAVCEFTPRARTWENGRPIQS